MVKNMSLKKTLLYTILTGYVAILALLFCMDYYLLIQHKEYISQQRQTILDNYMDKTASRMESIRKNLYNIVTTDENFQALSGKLSEIEYYSNAYELCTTLENQMLLEEQLQGFYLFFGSKDVPMYRVDIDQIPTRHASQIGCSLNLSSNIAEEGKFSSWFYLTVEDCTYLAISYKKGNAVLYGIQTLNDGEALMEEVLERDIQVVIAADGRGENYPELAENLGVLQATGESWDRFSYDQKGYSVYGEKIDNTNIWICPVIKNSFSDYITIQQGGILFLTMISFLLVITMIRFVYRQLVRPLNQIREEMEKIRMGDSKNIPEMDIRFVELREMLDTMQNMIVQLEKQRLLTYDTYIEKQRAQLQYLQLQLEPHFYINNLKMLNALAMEGKKEKIQTVILCLSEHMRYLLQAEKETTTLKKEMDFVNNYILLQNEMGSRQISLETELEEETKDCQVPTLILQTFVENSVKYAKIGMAGKGLKITISVHLLETENGQYMDVQVSDNGMGYPQEVLEEICRNTTRGKDHVGINNLKRRCQILYGEQVEFSFYNGNGAISECIIPKGGESCEGFVGG